MDLQEQFNILNEDRSFNIIDSILAEETLENARAEKAGEASLTHVRATIDKEYDRMGIGKNDEYSGNSGSSQLNYVQPTDDGYGGFLAEGLVG